MSADRFTLRFEELPRTLPVFPLAGAVVLPRQLLPLNIFEPRYLHMVLDALGAQRLIGMIQPRADAAAVQMPALYDIGCAGRISAFEETSDGRLLITLTGVCRFAVDAELEAVNGYRRVRPQWSAYRADLEEPVAPELDFARLEPTLRQYVEDKGLQASWEALRKLRAGALIDFLCTNLPLSSEEKQALVEAVDVDERARVLETAMQMAVRASTQADATRH